MFGRGAPVVYDDAGFNKEDFHNPVFRKLETTPMGSPVEIQDTIRAMHLLSKYRNRQLPNYENLKQELSKLINQKTTNIVPTGQPDNKVVFVNQNQWGVVFNIKSFTKLITVRKAVKQELSRRGGNPEDAWKHFKADTRQGLDLYQISVDMIPLVAPILEKNGYDVLDMMAYVQQSQNSMKRFEAVLLTDGGVEIGFDYDKKLVEFVKRARRRNYNGNEKKTWTIYEDKAFFNQLKTYLEAEGYDVSALDAIIDKMPEGAPAQAKTKPTGKLNYYNVYQQSGGKFHISIVPVGKGLSTEIAEFLRFSFPIWKGDAIYAKSAKADDPEFKESAIRTINKSPSYVQSYGGGKKPWAYEIRGLFSDYFAIESIISRFGFDTSEFRKIVMDLYNQGVIVKDKIPGVLDGFRKKDPTGRRPYTNDVDAFNKTLDENYEITKKDGTKAVLYDAQKEGVAFLYSRQSAILGDETERENPGICSCSRHETFHERWEVSYCHYPCC